VQQVRRLSIPREPVGPGLNVRQSVCGVVVEVSGVRARVQRERSLYGIAPGCQWTHATHVRGRRHGHPPSNIRTTFHRLVACGSDDLIRRACDSEGDLGRIQSQHSCVGLQRDCDAPAP
jgi:hypothetical protein